ncbi:hypothetical protein FOA52_015929 [Chlamydomonas sp. UWO 241]|nr:hypothetical protein FOA52_015929 [Chlamydomonas sp. UWO 241]
MTDFPSSNDSGGLDLLSAVAAGALGTHAEPGGVPPESDPDWEGAAREGPRKQSSRFVGVQWNKAKSFWRASLYDPQTKRERYIGAYATEEDAARAYDFAAVQARGPGAERNFTREANSEPPVSKGVEQKQRSSSQYIGVHKSGSSWLSRLWDPLTKRQRFIGSYATEEDAARAYDCVAVQANGRGTKRNFPGEDISEPPVTKGAEQKERSSSRYFGVTWHKANASWVAQLYDAQTKRKQYIGIYASEEDAARAHDFAAVQALGPGAERNFPGEDISEPPISKGEERKKKRNS